MMVRRVWRATYALASLHAGTTGTCNSRLAILAISFASTAEEMIRSERDAILTCNQKLVCQL